MRNLKIETNRLQPYLSAKSICARYGTKTYAGAFWKSTKILPGLIMPTICQWHAALWPIAPVFTHKRNQLVQWGPLAILLKATTSN